LLFAPVACVRAKLPERKFSAKQTYKKQLSLKKAAFYFYFWKKISDFD